MKADTPIYSSPGSWRSLGNRYTIYPDRVELRCWFLFWTFVTPMDEVMDIGIFPRFVFATNPTAIKIDLADLYDHVVITRQNGWIKKIAFTPNDPAAFIAALKTVANAS